jgi:AcrR family transcriptional regulator
MDNATRSERTRNAVIQAALAIIARDGPGRLTLDAIAQESGISKGGLMHQFRTKEAVLKALLEHQTEYFEEFSRAFLKEHGQDRRHPQLAAQIAVLRETLTAARPVVGATLGAVAQDPNLLASARALALHKVEAMRDEADDPDLALLRWEAANGLAISALLGLCPLTPEDRARLFERLLDDRRWAAHAEKAPAAE